MMAAPPSVVTAAVVAEVMTASVMTEAMVPTSVVTEAEMNGRSTAVVAWPFVIVPRPGLVTPAHPAVAVPYAPTDEMDLLRCNLSSGRTANDAELSQRQCVSGRAGERPAAGKRSDGRNSKN